MDGLVQTENVFPLFGGQGSIPLVSLLIYQTG